MSYRLLLCGVLFSLSLLGCTSGNVAVADGNFQRQVKDKADQVQSRFPAWVESGGDPSRIEPLGKQLDKHVRAKEFEEANAILDNILAILSGQGTAAPRAPAPATGPAPQSQAAVGPERQVELGSIPNSAEIIFSRRNSIYVMDADGGNEARITHDADRHLEHVAMSPDRKRIVINYFARPKEGGESSRMVLFDLERGVERDLVPDFHMAGNGGVDWDVDGYVYFMGVDRLPYAKPKSRAEHIANFAAHDVWKVRYDGTGLTRLTSTADRGEGDVSVSEDGTMIAFMDIYLDPPNDYAEVWVSNSDGSNPRLVYKGGKAGKSSVHDPELSPDNRRVIFSQVNPDHKNFRNDPNANTAHDLMSVAVDGTDARRVTEPGPISVIPDWKGSRVLYLLLTDREAKPFHGIVVMDSDGRNAQRIKTDANIAKWIPPRSQLQ